jgi:hypothetical protein
MDNPSYDYGAQFRPGDINQLVQWIVILRRGDLPYEVCRLVIALVIDVTRLRYFQFRLLREAGHKQGYAWGIYTDHLIAFIPFEVVILFESKKCMGEFISWLWTAPNFRLVSTSHYDCHIHAVFHYHDLVIPVRLTATTESSRHTRLNCITLLIEDETLAWSYVTTRVCEGIEHKKREYSGTLMKL